MIFGKKLDISRAKNEREAIKIIADHVRYMQEQLEMREKQQKLASLAVKSEE